MSELKVSDSTDAFVRDANHEYVNTYSEKIVEAFNVFAVSCGDFMQGSRAFPNAALHLEPSPAHMKRGELSFLTVWGSKTEMPLPRHYMIESYFGSTALGARFKRKTRELVTLDARGFFGSITLNETANLGKLTIVMGTSGNDDLHKESYIIKNEVDADLATLDIFANLKVHRPLTFNQGIRWIPRNGYIGATFSDEDEHSAQVELYKGMR